MIPTMPETGIRIQPCISPHFLGGGGREEIIQHALPESRRRAAWAWWVGCHMGWQIGLAIRHGAPFRSRDEREQAALISLTRWACWGRESAPRPWTRTHLSLPTGGAAFPHQHIIFGQNKITCPLCIQNVFVIDGSLHGITWHSQVSTYSTTVFASGRALIRSLPLIVPC